VGGPTNPFRKKSTPKKSPVLLIKKGVVLAPNKRGKTKQEKGGRFVKEVAKKGLCLPQV